MPDSPPPLEHQTCCRTEARSPELLQSPAKQKYSARNVRICVCSISRQLLIYEFLPARGMSCWNAPLLLRETRTLAPSDGRSMASERCIHKCTRVCCGAEPRHRPTSLINKNPHHFQHKPVQCLEKLQARTSSRLDLPRPFPPSRCWRKFFHWCISTKPGSWQFSRPNLC